MNPWLFLGLTAALGLAGYVLASRGIAASSDNAQVVRRRSGVLSAVILLCGCAITAARALWHEGDRPLNIGFAALLAVLAIWELASSTKDSSS